MWDRDMSIACTAGNTLRGANCPSALTVVTNHVAHVSNALPFTNGCNWGKLSGCRALVEIIRTICPRVAIHAGDSCSMAKKRACARLAM